MKKETKKVSKGEIDFLNKISEVAKNYDGKEALFINIKVVNGKPELYGCFDETGNVYFSAEKKGKEKFDYIG